MDKEGITLDLYSEESLNEKNLDLKNSNQADIMDDIGRLMDLADGETRLKLYDVGRNDPCPCGSGKKYKKCCGRVRSEYDKEYYTEKLSETNNLDEGYEILTEAEKNHPLDIVFIVELILISAQKRDLEVTQSKLLKLWRLIGLKMGENLLLMLLGILIQKEDLQQIREIEYNLEPEEISNPDLLIMFSLLNALNYNFQLAVGYLNRALKKEELPQNIEALTHLMYVIYEAEKYDLMFEVWLDNFKTINNLINKHGLKKIPLVSSLSFLLINSFGFETEKEFDSKTEIRKLADIFLKLNENIEAIDDRLDQNEIDEILTGIDPVLDEIAYDSVLYLMLLERLIGIEYYSAAEKYLQKAADNNNQNSEFLLLRARYNYYQDNLEQAKEDIEMSLKYYQQKSGFEKDNLMIDKLLILTARKEFSEVVKVLKDMKTEAETPLVTAVVKGLVPHPIRTNVKLFNSLVKLKEPVLFDQKKLYTAALYNIFIKRDMLSLELAEIRDDFEEVFEYMPAADSQLVQMAEIYLKSDKLTEAESLKELEKVNQSPAEFTREVEIKFEYNLKLRNYDYLLEERYFAAEKEMLQKGDFAFYKMIALLNAEGVERALKYLKKLSPEEGAKIFQRMLQEGDSFLREEKLLEEIEDRDIF